MPPIHPLDDVRRLAAAGTSVLVYDRAREVIEALYDLDPGAAVRFVLALVSRLEDGAYSETLTNKAPSADVYGCMAEGRAWYVKVALHRGVLHIISCHPPTGPIRTRGGTIAR